MNFYYYSSLDPTSPTGLRYDGSLYRGGAGLCAASPLVSNTPIVGAPYCPPAGGRALDLVVAPSTVVSLLAPQGQSTTNLCAGATYRLKTPPYMIWPKLFRSRDRVDKSVRCELCDMVLNSEQQAKQHFNGKHHLRRMRKLKLNSSASEEKYSEDLKYSLCKVDANGRKIWTKKPYEDRSDGSSAGVSNTADPAVDDEISTSAEDTANYERPEDETEALNRTRLKNPASTSAQERRLEYSESADTGTNEVELGKLDKADSEEELEIASDEFLDRRSNSQSCLTNSCSSSAYPNCALVQSSCHARSCCNFSCSACAANRCSLLHSCTSSIPSASCSSSPRRHDVLSQSSSQPSYSMSSVSPSIKMAKGYSMTPSLNSDLLSTSSTLFVPGSLLPRP